MLRSATAVACLLVLSSCAHRGAARESLVPAAPTVEAYVGARVYPAPGVPPIDDAVLLVEHGRIRALGPRAQVDVPSGAVQHELTGLVVVAGLWNAHVHFTAEPFTRADAAPAAELGAALARMLLRHGFVHVVDASSPRSTLALRRRVEAGELRGPHILTALAPLVPLDGTPRYVPVPLPEATSPEVAAAHVRAQLDAGADVVKLFTASLTEVRPFPVMPVLRVRAAADAAHARGALVLAHPTNLAGLEAAVEGGVDVLMDTAPIAGPLPEALLRRMVERDMALVPTLSLWEVELRKAHEPEEAVAAFTRVALEQVRAFRAVGGQVLFGTDVGYTEGDDPRREYALLREAGLDFDALLASLTTLPAARFGRGEHTGRLEPGAPADLVVLGADPAGDVAAFADVRRVVRAGVPVWGETGAPR